MKETFTAKTVNEAKELAAARFGVPQEKISFTTLEEPKRGLFGGLKGEAVVEAVYEMSKPELAADYVKRVIKAMSGSEPSVEIRDIEGGSLLEIDPSAADVIIGRRGETIDAMQYLASLVANKHDKEYYRLALDCDGFRDRRKAQLEELAKRMAQKAKRTGRTVSLEPMNPYERRIIHSVVTDMEGVTSRSIGDEPYRRVLISSTEKRPYRSDSKDRQDRSRGGRRGNQGRRRDFKARSLDISSSFEKDYRKPKPEDELGSGLYSKIEF